MSIEAMKQALDALEEHGTHYARHVDDYIKAITALRQAIAEAEKQKPVAFRNINTGEFCTGGFWRRDWAKWQPLYAAPVHAVDMSQERVDETAKDQHEFAEMVKKGTKAWANTPDDWVDDLRGGVEKQEPVSIKKVAKAHGIDMPDHFRDATKKVVPRDYSNSHQPVAWAKFNQGEITHSEMTDGSGCDFDLKAAGFVPLYTAPREWVGLTDEDRSEMLRQHHAWNEFGQAIEAKLREKNHG
jgi:hypothetical protein